MKTTVDLPQSLLKEAKKLAANQQTTVKALIEEGLRRVIGERQQKGAFRLRKATFQGKGLQSHWKELPGKPCGTGPMKVAAGDAIDTNILVYAHRENSPWHEAAY